MEKRLGRGLEALIPENTSKSKQKIDIIRVAETGPNPLQPRKRFNQEKMADLVNSIREKGVIQPILARRKEYGYEIIAGERRWRAAKELGLEEIPALIKNDIDDINSLEIALIENIQRENINPVEEADAYKEMTNRFGYTLDQIGQVVGRDKTTVSNSLRLLNLSQEIQELLREGKISTGHAKVLLSLQNIHKRNRLAQAIIKNGFSVRQLEQIVKSAEKVKTKISRKKDPEVQRIEEEMQQKLGTKVKIHHGKKRGRIEIQYYSNEDLQRLLGILLS